ncbi:MucBP domain-containing protein [Listeria costaricensis]|uniref:MucBP domain-containing protein n=1 Tax=Listeria costaricensis TaxID=2026604 RepID=UPI000C089D9D|nr:MucBP domain-containing protein [Listeria costaricensis]
MKKFISCNLLIFLLVLGILGTPATVFAATNVTFTHEDIQNLSASEKNSIIREKPAIEGADNAQTFRLIYEKEAPLTVSAETNQPTMAVKHVSQKENLPKTGDSMSGLTLAAGLILFLAGAFFIRKLSHETKKKLLLLVIGVGVFSAGQMVASADTAKLMNDTYKEVEMGHTHTHTPENIDGYRYVGYLTTPTPAAETGKVVVHYVDENNETLVQDTVLEGTVGDTYQTTPKEITGYTLKNTTGEESGQFSDTAKTVTYVYEKNQTAVEKGKVTVRYLDENNQPLLEELILEGNIGTNYQAVEKAISGFTLKSTIGEKTGIFDSQTKTITFIYKKNEPLKVTVNYSNAGALINTQTRGYISPVYYKVTAYDADGGVLYSGTLTEDATLTNGVFPGVPWNQFTFNEGESYRFPSKITYQCYSNVNASGVSIGDRLEWGDYEIRNTSGMTQGQMGPTDIDLQYQLIDLSWA